MTVRNVPQGEYGNIYVGLRGVCNLCGINSHRDKLDSLSAGQTDILQRYCRAVNITIPPPSGLVCKNVAECDRMIGLQKDQARVDYPAR